MAKLTISSLFVMALLASPSFALFFASEPRGIEHMDAREFDVMFRREVQAHKDVWVEVDEKLKVIDLPWLPFLSRTFLTRYRDLILKHNNKHRGHTTPITTATTGGHVSPSPSAPAGPPSPPAGGDSGSTAPPVTMPVPSLPPVDNSLPIIPDTNAAQAAVAARDYVQSLIARTYATFSGGELDTRGFADSDEDFFAREPQLQYTDELYERGYDDDLLERDFEEVDARGYEDEENYIRGYGAEEVEDNFAREADYAIDEVFGRDYYFDDLD